jgi:hypothetical protein
MYSVKIFRKIAGYNENISVYNIDKRTEDLFSDNILKIMLLLSLVDVHTILVDTHIISVGTHTISVDTHAISVDTHEMPGGMNLEPGGVNLELGGVNLKPGGVNLKSGGVNLELGGVNLKSGGVNLKSGGVNLKPEGVNLKPGGVNLMPGGVNLMPGGVNLMPGGMNENPIDKHNRQIESMPLLFCFPFKMGVMNIKINVNQNVTKIDCLWERIKSESNSQYHFRWYFVPKTSKKLEQLFFLVKTFKKRRIYAYW